MRYQSKQHSSGIVLILVLWILTILVVLAIGLGRATAIDLSLTRYKIARLKAKYIAWGGLFYVMNQIKNDTQDKVSSKYDSLYECGVKFDEEQSPESLFKDIALGDGVFRITYKTVSGIEETPKEFFGLSDEESKINLNALTVNNYAVVQNLLMALGIDSEISKTIATSIIDWKDADDLPVDPEYAGEEEYYQSAKKLYHCKNLPLDTLEELLLIRGMTLEIFKKIKDYVTIFPKDASLLLINPNTASPAVILALAESYSGSVTNTDQSDAKGLVDKVLRFRAGSDGQIMTQDDTAIDVNDLGLNPKETAIFLSLQKNLTSVSKYLRIQVKGIERNSKTVYEISSVVYRDNLSVVFIQQN